MLYGRNDLERDQLTSTRTHQDQRVSNLDKHLVSRSCGETAQSHTQAVALSKCASARLNYGVNATLMKEKLQTLIYDQLEIGEEELEEEDKYLLEINLDDLATTSGYTQTY